MQGIISNFILDHKLWDGSRKIIEALTYTKELGFLFESCEEPLIILVQEVIGSAFNFLKFMLKAVQECIWGAKTEL